MISGNTFLKANNANGSNIKVINRSGAIGSNSKAGVISDGESTLHGVALQIKDLINNRATCSEIDSDKTKQKYLDKIYAKLQSGRPLTPKQLAYLQKNEPLLYLYTKIIELKRKSVESQLRNCRSKEEAQTIQEFAISSIGKNNPIREMLINAVNYTIEEFKKTDSYKSLPETDKQANHNKKDNINKLKTDEDKQNDESDADEGDGLTIQYDISLGKYQEAYACSTTEKASSFSSVRC